MPDEKDVAGQADAQMEAAEEQSPESSEAVAAETPPEADTPAGEAPPGEEPEAAAEEADVSAQGDQVPAGDEANPEESSYDDAEAAMLKMLNDLPQDDQQASAEDIDFGSAQVSDAEFQHLQQPAGAAEPQNIDLLMDVDLPVSIELGRTKMAIADILALGPGSVVELNKLAGEPVDLLVNNKAVAKGEVVVVDENFGLRVTQLMTPEERLRALAEQ